MPIPFILAGLAVAAGGYGVKKGLVLQLQIIDLNFNASRGTGGAGLEGVVG